MNIQHEKRRALGHHRPHFGGDSTTKSETRITDSRVVGGDSSVNLSANDSQVTLTTTDHGAIEGALALGTQAISAATKSAENTVASAGSMFAGALSAANKASEPQDQSMLKIAGFVVVGLAAVALIPRIKG